MTGFDGIYFCRHMMWKTFKTIGLPSLTHFIIKTKLIYLNTIERFITMADESNAQPIETIKGTHHFTLHSFL